MDPQYQYGTINDILERIPIDCLSAIYMLAENQNVKMVSKAFYCASKPCFDVSSYILNKFTGSDVICDIMRSRLPFYTNMLRDQNVCISLIAKSKKNNYNTIFDLSLKYSFEQVMEGLIGMCVVECTTNGQKERAYYCKFADKVVNIGSFGWSNHAYQTIELEGRTIELKRPQGNYEYQLRDQISRWRIHNNQHVKDYSEIYSLNCLLLKLKDKKVSVALDSGFVFESKLMNLSVYIYLIEVIISFAALKGHIDIIHMTIESGINISQAYLDEYRHTTRVHSKLRDYLTNILNGTLHIDIFKSTQPKKKTLRKGTTIQKSVQTSSASTLPSTVPLKNFTILFTIGCLGFKQKKVFNYILKRDLHEVEAAFLLFHTISLGTWGHVNEVITRKNIDITKINDLTIDICARSISCKRTGIINIVQTLINHGLSLEKYGYRLLVSAVSRNAYALIDYLTRNNIDSSYFLGRPKSRCLPKIKPECVPKINIKLLEENGLDTSVFFNHTNTRMLLYLLDLGVNPAAKNYNLIRYFIWRGSYKVLSHIFNYKIQVKKIPPSVNILGMSESCCKNKSKMIMFLINLGIDPSSCNNWALKYACKEGDYELARFLVSKGVKIKKTQNNGIQDLCENSVWNGKIFRFLVKNGASEDSHKKLALKRISEENDTDSIKFVENIKKKRAKTCE